MFGMCWRAVALGGFGTGCVRGWPEGTGETGSVTGETGSVTGWRGACRCSSLGGDGLSPGRVSGVTRSPRPGFWMSL